MLKTWNDENIAYPQTQNLHDYSWPFYAVSDILRLFAAVPSAILFFSWLYARVKLDIYWNYILVYSVKNEDKLKYDYIKSYKLKIMRLFFDVL